MTPEEAGRSLDRLAATRSTLLARPSSEIAVALGRVGERFGDPDDPLARDAIQGVQKEAGLSAAMTRRIVLGMARDWTRERLSELLEREFPDPTVLDRFVPDPRGGRWLRAMGDPVAVHIGSGSVPGVSTTSLIRSLLVKTPALVKPGRGDRALTEAFRRALQEEAPALADSAEVAYWARDDDDVLTVVLRGASRIVVYGSDAVAREVRDKTPITTPTVVYHHRFSVAVLGPGATVGADRGAAVAALARAASTFDQRGCVSPHRVFLPGAGPEEVRGLGEALAGAMEAEAREAPAGQLDPQEAASLQQLRAELAVRAAVDRGVAIWSSPDASWTVAVDPDPSTATAGHPRTVVLVPLPDEGTLVDRLRPLAPHLQSVGLAGLAEPARLVERLAESGVTRVVPLETLPFPPAWWVHDGDGGLRALVRWVEWQR